MARVRGVRTQIALAFETSYGPPPVGGFMRMPPTSTTLGAEQPLLNSELLGYPYLPRANVGTTSAASYMSLLSGDAA